MSDSLLAKWFANPLNDDEAHNNIIRLQQKRQIRYRRGIGCWFCQLQLLVANFFLDEDVNSQFEVLLNSTKNNRRAQAATYLVMGQLLISKRLTGAMFYLDMGFKLASPLLKADDYFRLLQQHQLLKRLPLTDKALPAITLEGLITMAKVIEKFPNEKRKTYHYDPNDLYG